MAEHCSAREWAGRRGAPPGRGLSIEKDTVARRASTALVKCEDTDGTCGGGG